MAVDDVAVDFPDLTLILAHGGRPLWMDQAFFLVRRFPKVHMDVSGIPPKALLTYFPRLAEIAATVAEELDAQLKAPVRRLGAPRIPIAYAPPLEDAARVTAEMIAEGLGALMRHERRARNAAE